MILNGNLQKSKLCLKLTRSRLTFPAGRLLLAWDGQAESRVGWCCAAAPGCQSWESWVKVHQHLSPPICLIFRIFPHFQDLSSRQDLHCLLFGASVFSPRPLSFGNASLWHPLLSRMPIFCSSSSKWSVCGHATRDQLQIGACFIPPY